VRTRPEHYEWRYLLGGRRTHALISSLDRIALCGRGVGWRDGAEEWRGTGTQDEYERAARLPRCLRCVRTIEMEL
jgi:hypothetical protein